MAADERVVYLERYLERLKAVRARLEKERDSIALQNAWTQIEKELITQLSADETRLLVDCAVITDNDLHLRDRLAYRNRVQQLAALDHLTELAEERLRVLMGGTP